MEKETNDLENKSSVNYEKILVYVGIISFLLTFWQGWRDLHKDNLETRERLVAIEQKLWPKQ